MALIWKLTAHALTQRDLSRKKNPLVGWGWVMMTIKQLQDLDSFCKMLEFGKFNGKWDVKIDGLGCTYYVSEVEKTAA